MSFTIQSTEACDVSGISLYVNEELITSVRKASSYSFIPVIYISPTNLYNLVDSGVGLGGFGWDENRLDSSVQKLYQFFSTGII